LNGTVLIAARYSNYGQCGRPGYPCSEESRDIFANEFCDWSSDVPAGEFL
jgi:hypothetical protein